MTCDHGTSVWRARRYARRGGSDGGSPLGSVFSTSLTAAKWTNGLLATSSRSDKALLSYTCYIFRSNKARLLNYFFSAQWLIPKNDFLIFSPPELSSVQQSFQKSSFEIQLVSVVISVGHPIRREGRKGRTRKPRERARNSGHRTLGVGLLS